ncbi:MAG: helix-turn-helix domain-containing protein [Candidatus Beckwithbacteria bacterium]
MKKASKITAQERDLIAVWYSKGLSRRKIARKLGRHYTSIAREIKRNSFKHKYYIAIHAQARTRERVVVARKRPTLKNPQVYKWTPDLPKLVRQTLKT